MSFPLQKYMTCPVRVTEKIRFTLLSVVALLFFFVTPTFASPPQNFQTTSITSQLNSPTAFDIAPDGRIFILEKGGVVKIFKNGEILNEPFATVNVNEEGERGLLGIAFDPEFTTNHYVYLYYTGADLRNRVVRYTAISDIASELTTLYINPIDSWLVHHAGTLAFGPDGKLYISVGNNGSPEYSSDLTKPFGKIFRINKDGSIPFDNPFVNQGANRAEIWAYGLRNPFRMQFDSQTGRLYVGDVGDSTWEEINLITKGSNYGYPQTEGACENCSTINPIYQYFHDNSASYSITGGPIYRGSMFPSDYIGSLFFADYAQGFIKRLTLDDNGNQTGVQDFDTDAGSVVDMKVASDGSLYYLTIYPGELFRVRYITDNQPPVAKANADKTTGVAPLEVHFSSDESSDPENDQLTYVWDFGDGTTSTEQNPTKTFEQKGRYTVSLTVSDSHNQTKANPITIEVGIPPVITITNPVDQNNYNAGDTIEYQASARDSDGNTLSSSSFKTEVLFHHGTHIHPFLVRENNNSGTFTIPVENDHPDANTWYEIRFTAIDSNNLTAGKSVSINPNTANLSLVSEPLGLSVTLDSIPQKTPVTIEGVVGFQRVLEAPLLQEKDGKYYQFEKWSNTTQNKQTILTPQDDTTYTAFYKEVMPYQAEYFNNKALSGTPVLKRVDQTINFSWNDDSPDQQVSSNQFSARWTKEENFVEGLYRFSLTADDGVRVFIDGQKVLDKWFDQAQTEYSFEKYLFPGKHSIVVEYYENFGGAIAQFSYKKVSQPMSGFTGEYFSNKTLSGTPTLVRENDTTAYVFNHDAPDPLLPNDNFSIRFTKQQQFKEGDYTFLVRAGDGIRMYIDDTRIIDDWTDHATGTYKKTVHISEGEHTIQIEYYDHLGGAAVIVYQLE